MASPTPFSALAPRAPASAPEIFVTVADLRHSNNANAVLTTLALGSCLGITCYDRNMRVGALLHAMLPDSRKHPASTPVTARYLDLGVPAMIEGVLALGGNERQLELKVFGGAQILQSNEYFSIGRQNVEMMKALVAQYRLNVVVWDVGGAVNRSIRMQLSDGRVRLRMPNRMEISV